MSSKEIFEKILEMERICGEDFYDLGGGDSDIMCNVKNSEALDYLKDTRPLIYKHICESYMFNFAEDLNNVNVDDISYDEIFIFDYQVNDENLYKEISDFNEFDDSYHCFDDDLWKIVISILAVNFTEIYNYLSEIFEEYE